MINEKLKRKSSLRFLFSFSFIIFGFSVFAQSSILYLWHHESTESLASRFDPPQGFLRLAQPEGSFGAWLRGLPLLPGNPPVQLFNGAPKQNQQPHAAVLDIDAGTEDLQQCADAIIRLRAEYLFSVHRDRDIVFHFTSGDKAAWTEWQKGLRPEVRGNRVTWKAAARPDSSYANFRRYLSTVFRYAGTLSLSKELQTVSDPSRVEIGDVFIHGGSPGHAVLVVDVAENDKGERVFILAQSYMPAQQIEILRTVLFPRSPWYTARPSGILETPEWEFQYEELKRFR